MTISPTCEQKLYAMAGYTIYCYPCTVDHCGCGRGHRILTIFSIIPLPIKFLLHYAFIFLLQLFNIVDKRYAVFSCSRYRVQHKNRAPVVNKQTLFQWK